MTNGGGDRLDRIERILEKAATRQEQFEAQAAKRQEEDARRQEAATGRQEQFEAQAARHHERFEEISRIQGEMAARQQYHDEAFEWNDAAIKRILEAQAVDGEHIRALVRIAELHHLRLEGLEGGEAP